MNERLPSRTPVSVDEVPRDELQHRPAPMPPPPRERARTSGWTPGRVVAVVIGSLLTLVSVGLLGAGGTALWADLSRRDATGFVTSDIHSFSTPGSALVTDPVELGDPGVGWLYSEVVLGEVRLRVTPSDPSATLFVGIGPTADVDRYLAGVRKTVIQDIWTDELQATGGGTAGSPPGTQDFWVASTNGTGTRTLRWDPANGSWTVVVMDVDGTPGIDVRTDVGAEMPTLLPIAIGSLTFGTLFLVGGLLMIVAAVRRSRTG